MSEWDDIRGEFGDKVVGALVAAVTGAREDLATYRTGLPTFAYEHSGRGLAGWIHDRMWAHLQRELFEVPGVSLIDNGPTREVTVGLNYRLRIKRHSVAGGIRNYPTATALAFWDDDDFTLPGLGEVHLCFGYVWDPIVEQILDAVVSRRSDQNKVLWMERLDEQADGGTGSADVEPIVPPTTPSLPSIQTPTTKSDEKDGTETT